MYWGCVPDVFLALTTQEMTNPARCTSDVSLFCESCSFMSWSVLKLKLSKVGLALHEYGGGRRQFELL